MSRGDDLHEGRRWLDTAAEDLRAAQVLTDGGVHARACFAAQQCGEKALKAVWHARGEQPWGHSIQKLVVECGALVAVPDLDALRRTASSLDRHHIATRYPNGLPDLTPEQAYFVDDAAQAVRQAEWLLQRCRRLYDETAGQAGAGHGA